MAKQRFGINDAYRGTVGTVIGYAWRGKWCLRARPLRVHNPRTERQQANRMLFKQMVALAGHMKCALRTGLHNLAMQEHVTECNLFVKRNKECFSMEGERLVVDWERVVVSEGDLATPVFCDGLLSQPQAAASSPNLGEQLDSKSSGKKSLDLGVLLDSKKYLGSSPVSGEGDRRAAVVEGSINDGAITIPFLPCAPGQRASGDDAVYVYAYCPEIEEGVLSAPAWRRSGSVQLTLPERWRGKEVHFYGFAVDYEGNASDSVYLGALEETEEKEMQKAASLQSWNGDTTISAGTRQRGGRVRLSPS